MLTEEITIRVDPEAAAVYRAASAQDRLKLDLLLNLKLRDVGRPGPTLVELMDEISRKAKERGLTEEILQELLSER